MSEDIHKWSDGRYTLMFDEHTFFVFDNDKEERMTALEVTKKLNEQQATIKQFEEDKAIAEDYANIFEKENVKLRKNIRRLQDLCGESDGENAKLRIENKKLQEEIKLLKPTNIEQYEQIQKLQKENEQLQAQLREKEQDEQLYANEIVKLNKEAKEVLDFKSLGGDY